LAGKLGRNLTAAELIDQKIEELADWRGEMVRTVRAVIHEADPAITEEWKWGTAVWSHNGLVCAVATLKDHVKINFFKGAALADPGGMFNSGLDAKKTRAIDIFEGGHLDEAGLRRVIDAALAANGVKV